MRTLTTLLAAAAILCFMTPMTQAQTATTGQIVGVVTDPSGALVVGAKVALTSDAGVRREVTTGGNGRYTFPLLDPGAYRLEVTHSGFASVKLEGVVVQITESSVADVALKVAGAPTTVSVTGESPLVQTESSARGTVIDEKEIDSLPLPTRNFQQLLTLTTGTSGSLQNSSELGRGDVAVYVNGQRALSNNMIINGVDANSIGTGENSKSFRPVHRFAPGIHRADQHVRCFRGPQRGWQSWPPSPSPAPTSSMAMPTSSCGIPFWMQTISS